MKTAVVLGTSRSQGNTYQLAQIFIDCTGADLFHLCNYDISVYDYEHRNISDDFISLMRELVEYEHVVFASPVYWYSMSAQMKIFFDRLSDLLTVDKCLGYKLRFKRCSILATGCDETLPDCFIEPFKLTANYLSMEFKDSLYLCCPDELGQKEREYAKQMFGII